MESRCRIHMRKSSSWILLLPGYQKCSAYVEYDQHLKKKKRHLVANGDSCQNRRCELARQIEEKERAIKGISLAEDTTQILINIESIRARNIYPKDAI